MSDIQLRSVQAPTAANPGSSVGHLGTPSRPAYRLTLVILASLFFVWGFAAVMNNALLPHLRVVFDLTYAQEMTVGATYFVAFFSFSLPAASLVRRVGHRRTVIAGLMVMAAGALCMALAAAVPSYRLVMMALAGIAAGATLLEVSANPYVATIGPPETASSRLTLVQGFNSLGTMVAPLFGGGLILARSRSGSVVEGALVETRTERLADAHSIVLPYLLMAVVLIVLATVVLRLGFVDGAESGRRMAGRDALPSLSRHSNLLWGVVAIALYEVTEIGCANLFINFASQPTTGDLTHTQAARCLFLLWGGMMVGRFGGGFIMRRISPERVLAAASVLALAVLLVAAFGSGTTALVALVSVGLFHSIMFPTIFALAIRGLGPLLELGSGLLIMAIGGGALTVGQGWLADRAGVQISFMIPALCELFILFYALKGSACSPIERMLAGEASERR